MTNFVRFDSNWRPPVLETERLVLRPYSEADAPRLHPLVSNPNTTRFTLWEHHKTLEETRQFVHDYALCRYAECVPEPMAVCSNEEPLQPIGSCGCFWASCPHQTMEIGYWLAEPYWGRGITVEACRTLIEYAFATYQPRRIQARVIAGNDASVRVLEKLGFVFEGTLRSAILRRGQFEDVMMFAVVRH